MPKNEISTKKPRMNSADKFFSTFYWKMKLDRSQPCNIVEEMTGYSKFEAHDEARDKKQLLMTKIVMLKETGWLDKSEIIYFYQRTGAILNKDTAKWILSISKEKFEGCQELREDFPMMLFLEKYYQCIKTGVPVSTLIPARKANFSKDEYLNIDIQNKRIGNDELKLNAYFFRLLNNGHAPGAVNHFYNSYKQKFLS